MNALYLGCILWERKTPC